MHFSLSFWAGGKGCLFRETGLPPSPGSLSDRSMANMRVSRGAAPSPYAAAMAGGVMGPEEVHASSLSLASTSSSVYSSVSASEAETAFYHRERACFRRKRSIKRRSGSYIAKWKAIERKSRL